MADAETSAAAASTPASESAAAPVPAPADGPRPLRVLVLQGGGALGSYQGGVWEALAGEEVELDWVTGISIGAINAALIAGNPPELRVERMRAFWEQVTSGFTPAPPVSGGDGRTFFNGLAAGMVMTFGAPGFFAPRWPGPMLASPGTTEAISWYDTTPLKETLERLVDFERLNSGDVRISVGAVDVATGNAVTFDSYEQRIGPEHIMASGALPPGFPPVEIDGALYWDGGLVSNTPLQFVLDVASDRPLLIMQVDLFNARGEVPKTLLEVDEREKDIRYSSRTRMNTDAGLDLHKAKMALRTLLEALPEELAGRPETALVRDLARENAVTIIQLIYRKRAYEGGSKDYEFSRQTMIEHWASGKADAERALRKYRGHLDTSRPGVTVLDPGRHDGDDVKSEPQPRGSLAAMPPKGPPEDAPPPEDQP